MPVKRNHVYHGDCLEVMADFPDNTFDAVITDPPYGLFFMSSDWDHGIPGVRFWVEMLRVCKPGAMLFAFGGARTHHRLMTAIEDAGWEIRNCINHFYPADEREAALLDSMTPDQVQAYLELHHPNNSLAWLYGQGFPKSHALGKAIDRAAGTEREVVSPNRWAGRRTNGSGPDDGDNCYGQYGIPGSETAPATPAAQAWDGHGTALKPGWEPIIVAMKPIAPITSDALYQATGWDHWHHDTALKNTPKNRLKLRKKGVILKPDYGELELKTVKRKALHPGIESDTLLLSRPKRRHRSESSAWQTVGRYDAKPYRRWKTNSFAANALVWDVAGLWIDGARIESGQDYQEAGFGPRYGSSSMPNMGGHQTRPWVESAVADGSPVKNSNPHPAGRWPANVLLSHHPGCVPNGVKRVKGITGGKNPHKLPAPISLNGGFKETENRTYFDYAAPDGTETVAAWDCHPDCPIFILDQQAGVRKSGSGNKSHPESNRYGGSSLLPSKTKGDGKYWLGDTGTASRFFKTFPAARFLYTPKASRKERNQGLEGLEEKVAGAMVGNQTRQPSLTAGDGVTPVKQVRAANHHPTVKPLSVISWLASLSRTPTGGLVLDPFGGSGTTALACLETDRDYVLIEKEADYVRIARARIAHAQAQPRQLSMLSE